MEVFDTESFLSQKEDEIVRKFLILRKSELILLAQKLQLEIKLQCVNLRFKELF